MTNPSSAGQRHASTLDWLRLREFAAAPRPLILPVGSFEQHGPHLPVGTDAIIADALAAAVADAVDGLVLPALTYGAPSKPRSGGGDLFPAPALRLPTLMDVAAAVCRGCLAMGASQLIVLSWHYENAAVLWDAVQDLMPGFPGATTVMFDAPWDLIDEQSLSDVFGDLAIDWGADHAGLLETAIMLHLAPDCVGEAPAPRPHRRRVYDVLPTPADAVPDSGVVNDARGVTAADGRRCFDAMVAGIARAFRSEFGS